MWRSLAKRTSTRRFNFLSKDSTFIEKLGPPEAQAGLIYQYPLADFHRFSAPFSQNGNVARLFSSIPVNPFGLFPLCKAYGTAAAQARVSTDDSELSGSDELHELVREANQQNRKSVSQFRQTRLKKMVAGIGIAKYTMLKKRQIKMETEAWEEAAKEYEELLADMCEQKLAPNLPYVKSLFLGWFEPLRNAIDAEQELVKKNLRSPHGPYFDQLPTDMMAVITMHKLMGLLMTSNGGSGNIRVVQAALAIGEAVEQEARVHRVLEKTKKKNHGKDKKAEGESDAVTTEEKKSAKEQEKLRKKVASLMKKQKVHELRKTVKDQDDAAPWGQDAQVKVFSTEDL